MVAGHQVLVRGADLGAAIPELTILERTDQEFIPAVLDELSSENGLAKLSATVAVARDKDGVLRLYQPIHRAFHVALVELACDTFGRPRLDPDRVESAGLVIRRVATDTDGEPLSPERLQGWMKAGESLRGWLDAGGLDDPAGRIDPDPAFRTLPYAGPVEIRRRLALREGSISEFSEEVSPLFLVPPDVQAKSKKTALYGMVSLASSDESEAPDQLPEYSADEIKTFLSPFLTTGPYPPWPRGGETISDDDARNPVVRASLQEVITLAEQVDAQFDAFGDSPEGAAVLAQLNLISLPLEDGGTVSAGAFLRDFRNHVVLMDDGSVEMPESWPALGSSRADALLEALRRAGQARLNTIAPRERRFAGTGELYRLRAFVRVRGHEGCPSKIVWSDYSERFRIVPWYEPGPRPPVPVELPDVTSKSVRDLKPTVAFQMPESLFNTLKANEDVSALIDGNGQEGGPQFGLGWICSINLPVITICAFICLNIFLKLFDLFFHWLLFIKICLPYPKKK